MYINGFIIPVPTDKKDAYHQIAAAFGEFSKEFGVLEIVEAWEADVPDGTLTDFRKAVNLEEGEKVVFSWVIWPDKETADASHEKMMADPRMKEFGEMPFDGKRMVIGGFEPIFTLGRD